MQNLIPALIGVLIASIAAIITGLRMDRRIAKLREQRVEQQRLFLANLKKIRPDDVIYMSPIDANNLFSEMPDGVFFKRFCYNGKDASFNYEGRKIIVNPHLPSGKIIVGPEKSIL